MRVRISKLLLVILLASTCIIYFYKEHHYGLSLPPTKSIAIGQDAHMEFILIGPGTFFMGSSLYAGGGEEAPEHEVAITTPYYLGKFEVTQYQWNAVMGNNPSAFQDEQHPVDSVSWNDAELFLTKLHSKTGLTFALPTEAQWEYAARAGTRTKWDFGSNESSLGDYAWFGENANEATHPVGQKKPNTWGLYDMYGNVQEWCKDWYESSYPKKQLLDPQGPDEGELRVLRGGAWGDDFSMVRSAYRNAAGPDIQSHGTGLRVVMKID